MNEEPQSSNKELEISWEELQALNEELNTVNDELREKIDELQSANDDLVNLMNSTEVATIFLDLNRAIRRFTPSAKKLFNLIPSDVGRPIGDLSQRFSDDDLADHTRRVMETLAPITKEVKTDAGQWFIRRILPFRTQDNRVDGLVLTFSDVMEMKEVEAELRESEEKFRNLFENMMHEVHFWKLVRDEHGSIETWRLVDANPAALKAWGKKRSEILGKTTNEIFSHDAMEIFMPIVKKIFETGAAVTWETYFQGTDQFLHMTSVPFGEYFISTGTDISDRKKTEVALQNALAEKESLLREIHHRVKNNMQTIVGLLRMHARRVDDSQLTQIFNDCRDRVTAMSLIHESLYQSDDLARIDFKAYLKKLCRNLGRAYKAGDKKIALVADVDDVSLNMDQGIAVGLVVSELISNAFKHAFPGEESGIVAVNVKSIGGGMIELIVADDGAGLPADFDIRKTASLGLKLVEATVTRELGGTIDVERDSGARFIIRFKSDNEN